MSYVQLQDRQVEKTRKLHRCSCCREMIPVGSPCHYSASKFDGDFYEDYLCTPCDNDHQEVILSDPSDWYEFSWDEMWEAVRELRAEREANQ